MKHVSIVLWVLFLPFFFLLKDFNRQLEDMSYLDKAKHFSPMDPCAGANLGGHVWKDYNTNGIQDSNDTISVGGIAVAIYDSNGNQVGTDITDTNGDWHVDPTGFSFPVRVEFSQIPSGTFWTLNGTNSPTSVQIITSASCTVDAGLGDIFSYCESNPIMVTTCYEETTASDLDIVISFSYENQGTAAQDKTAITHSQQGGALWGLAYNKPDRMLYTAALLKTHIPLGPAGLDAIYTIDPFSGTPNAMPWIELTDDLGIAVSAISAAPQYHTNTARDLSAESQNDANAFQDVGKTGLGDIEISADGKTLYVVNLYDKNLYAIDIDTKMVTGTFPIPDPGCVNGVARPWALGENNGEIFVGVTCDGSASGNPANLADNSGVANLTATVYRLDGTAFTQVLNFPLDYPREPPFQYSGGCDLVDHWKPWSDVLPQTCADGNIGYPTPLLSGIEFSDSGDMILGFLDRTGLQFGYSNYGPTGTTKYSMYAAGDILKACSAGSTWIIESTLSGCSSAGGLAINTYDTDGYDVGWDKLDKHGEFYEGDYFHGDGNIDGTGLSYFPGHPEITIGGLAVVPGTNEVMSTSYDPVTGASNFNTGGVITLDNTTGQRPRNGYQIYLTGPTGTTSGKGLGLGDLEVLCSAPPIQIGNYVWYDENMDGIQAPDEAGIPNVNVSLYEMVGGTTTLIASTITAGDGTYYFTDYEEHGARYDTLTPGNMYFIVVGEAGQFNTANNLLTVGGNEYQLTSQNTGEGANPDLNDSDAYLVSDNTKPFARFPVDTVTIGAAGYVNHSLDFGFAPPPPPPICPEVKIALPVNITIRRGKK